MYSIKCAVSAFSSQLTPITQPTHSIFRSLKAIPAEARKIFADTADQVIALFDTPKEALSACLAHISGYTSMTSRSLINSEKGQRTMLLECDTLAYSPGFL